MKNITILIIIISGFIAAGATSTLTPSRFTGKGLTVSGEIVKKCDTLATVECDKSCDDGWQITGYYDSKKTAGGPAIKAIQTMGVCKRCFIRFALLESSGSREVTCEEFFLYIDNAKGCLTQTTLSDK